LPRVTKNTPARKKEDRHFVTAVARAMSVLECFRSGEKTVGNHEIAKRCKLPKSTVSRLTHTLTRLNYLAYDEEEGRYSVGTAGLALASVMIGRLSVRQLARPLMQELANFTNGVVALTSRDRLSMIYLDVVRSSCALTLSLEAGSRIPLATTAAGRAYLAAASERDRGEVFGRLREQDEAAWPVLKSRLERAQAEYRQLGVAASFGEWQSDVNAIAVGIRVGNSRGPMTINCGGPAFTLSKPFLLDEARPRLIELARQIEAALGQGAVSLERL
jgi:DNA-binding IclR family transcriptional regulator